VVIQSLTSIYILIKIGLVVDDKYTKSIKHKVIWIKARLSLIFKGVQQIRVPIRLHQIHLSLNHKEIRYINNIFRENKQHKTKEKIIDTAIAYQILIPKVMPFSLLVVQSVAFFFSILSISQTDVLCSLLCSKTWNLSSCGFLSPFICQVTNLISFLFLFTVQVC